MSDLISKEEVLNLIDTAFESGAFDGRYAYENLIDAVQNLIYPLETDLISRQAAEALFRNARKELMEQDRKEHIKDFNTRDLMLLNAEQLIHLLPSAWPKERTETHACDCISGETHACDCISRQAVIDRINKLIEVEKKQGTDDWGYGRERVNAYEAMLHFVKSEYLHPSVEPERKTGKWVGEQQWCLPKCSICGASCFGLHGFDAIKTPYCPTCGAKMEVDG